MLKPELLKDLEAKKSYLNQLLSEICGQMAASGKNVPKLDWMHRLYRQLVSFSEKFKSFINLKVT